jgi:hypothetical protein
MAFGHGLKLRLPLGNRSQVGNDDLVAGCVGAVANGFTPFIPIWTKLRDVTRNRIQCIASIRRQTVIAWSVHDPRPDRGSLASSAIEIQSGRGQPLGQCERPLDATA